MSISYDFSSQVALVTGLHPAWGWQQPERLQKPEHR
jgi:hypothetical protein